MTSPFDRLGIPTTASATEIRAAYHTKLREFPAHSHPEEFKAIRSAYDAIRKGEAAQSDHNFLKVRPLEATLDPESLEPLRQKALALIEVSIDDLIRATF